MLTGHRRASPTKTEAATAPARPDGDPAGDVLGELIASVRTDVGTGLASVGLAESEIEQAIKRHPDAENDLYIISPAWGTEFIYRGHCRELLERVAKGEDTRPGTAAECCLAMSAVSMKIPLHGAASGFYFRMWRQAFSDHEIWPEGADHHEALYSGQIDDIERHVRHRLSQPTRRLDTSAIECDSEHWGQPVTCKYATGGAS
jgi:hypothetical protein